MLIRPAVAADADYLRVIYNREVLESTVTLDLVPRTLAEQENWLQARSGGLAVLVAEQNGEIAGFASLSFYRDRPGYRTSVEDSIYISPSFQGLGIGSELLGELLATARLHGFHAIFAKIVGGKPASVTLHEKHGFVIVGVEREVARKFNKWHDVTIMQRLL